MTQTQRKFWLQCATIDTSNNTLKVHTSFIVSTSVEAAIKEVYGFVPRPASPIKYDVCSQEQGEAGYRYWFTSTGQNHLPIRAITRLVSELQFNDQAKQNQLRES